MILGYDAKRVFHNNTGLGNYGRSLIDAFSEYYPEHSYLLYNPKPCDKKLYLPNMENTRVIKPEMPWSLSPSLWRSCGVNLNIKRDRVNIYHGLSGELPLGIKKYAPKSIVTVHDMIFLRYPELYKAIDRGIYLKKVRYAVDHANMIIAISEQTKTDIIRFLKVPEEKIRVIYQGCDDVFKERYSDSELKQVLSKYRITDKFILNVGTVEPRKNALTIAKAIRDIDITLVIVGKKKPYAEDISNYAKSQKIQHKIIFLEDLSRKELAILYRSAEIFVFPSFFEGFGIPIVEAMYSHTPVITSKGSCFEEVGGAYNIYINPKDEKELASKIHFLLHNKKEATDIADKNLIYTRRFDNDKIAQAYMNVYKSLT